MAMQENQDCLFGSGSITAVDGMTRGGCWETLATLMNVYHNDQNKKASFGSLNRMKLTGDEMMKRWNQIKKRYMDTKKYFDKSTGTGLLDQDIAKGLDTTEKKKESMCPRYELINDIIGHKANVTPYTILDTARPTGNPLLELDPGKNETMIDPRLDSGSHDPRSIIDHQAEGNHLTFSPEQSTTLLETELNLEDQENNSLSPRGPRIDGASPTKDTTSLSTSNDFNSRFSSPDLPNIESPNQDQERSISPTQDRPESLSPIKQAPQSIRTAAKMVIKRKRGPEPVGSRPMKPLPSVNPHPGRQKAPGAAIVKDRDDNHFQYFDRKMEEKRKSEMDLNQSQAKLAQDALKWDKEKYENEHIEASRAESSKSKMQSDLADKNINWEREKFNQENLRLIKAEESRVEIERINTRREVMQACQIKGMSIQEMKDYMELLFAK